MRTLYLSPYVRHVRPVMLHAVLAEHASWRSAAQLTLLPGTGVLPSLQTNGKQRSNVGVFAAASHAPLVIEVTMLSPAGANLGSQFIVVDEAGFIHRQLPVPPAESSTAVVRIVDGDGIVVPYASTVDNATAESLFVSGAPVSAHGAAARSMLLRTLVAEPEE